MRGGRITLTPMSDRPACEIEPGVLPACPFLPDCPEEMSWRSLNELANDRSGRFFLRALQYGQFLWIRGLVARAVLSVDRGLLADLESGDPILGKHPLPYRALAWMISSAPADSLVGNPRVHYQHLADRVRGDRAAQRAWRAWGMWHISRLARPEFPGDPRHEVTEPSPAEIQTGLETFGLRGEFSWWKNGCDEAKRSS